MADASAGFDYPLSPWAQRFGQSRSGTWSGMNGQDHSGLAPSQPALDPRYYGDDGLPSGDVQPLPLPPLEELDKLYLSEEDQTTNLMGFRTWELGPLNNTLYGDISAGHRRPASAEEERNNISAFERGMIVVDESKWFPWFRRDNWWQHRIQDDERKLPGRKHWSVDDDEVWKELRIVLELANRILSLLVDTRHPLMVAAALGELDPSANPQERRIRVDPANKDRFTVEQLRERITAMGDELIICSFILDRWSIKNRHLVQGVYHYIQVEPHPIAGVHLDATTGLMGFATFRLRALVEGDLTMGERCMAQFAMAKTITHECMHAFFSWYTPRDGSKMLPDPIINDEISREIGRSYENMIFGGRIHAAPIGRHLRTGESWVEGVALSLFAEPFPGRRGTKYGQTQLLPVKEDANIVPLLWISALLSEQFWKTEVAKHGSQALMMPRYVKTETNYSKGRTIMRPETIRIDTPMDTLRERLQTTALDFNRRYLQWTEMRPWYQEESFKWAISPWRSDTWRSAVQHFKMAHAVQDEFECWRESERVMAQYTPKRKTTWLYHAVGLLMKAATPLRLKPVAPRNKGWCDEELFRSRAAEQNPDRHKWAKVPKHRIQRWDWAGESMITMPLDTYVSPVDETKTQYNIRSHMSYLNLYQKWVDLHERLDPLPRGWHASLDETYRMILQNRQSDPVAAASAEYFRTWGPWDFKVPPYDDRWQSWDLVSDGQGGMRRELKDEEPPRKYADTRIAKSGLSKDTFLRDKIDRDARAFLATNPQGEPIPYFTVSQVGEHHTADSAWIVVPRNNGVPDVYDVTEALKQLNATTANFRTLTRMTDNGLQLNTAGGSDANHMAHVQLFLRTHIRWKMVGKLAIPRAEAAVRENDGSNGLPLYKTFGKEVYDLTRFNCPPHWKPILLGDPGGPIDETMPGFYREMVLVIDKYRCGTVLELPSKPRAEVDLTPFTERMLRWHDNPNMGVYFAVDGFVYDMSKYLDSHPGGLESLKQYAGRDASAPFAEAHPTNPLLTSPYNSLRIGRIVPEVPFSQVQANHIVLDTWVYNIAPTDGDTSGLFQVLQGLGGTDVTETLTRADAPADTKAALGSLKANHQSRVVARVQQAVMPDITREELAQHGDPNDAGAWVAIGENVWDLTAMMLQPEWYNAGANGSRAIDPRYAGKAMGPEAADYATWKNYEAWLREKYSHLLVAELVDGRGGVAENMDLD